MAQQQYVTMPNGSEYEFDPFDFQYHCLHANVKIEDNSFDYAGTHATYGQSGTHVQHNAICQDCDEDISESYDWEGHCNRDGDIHYISAKQLIQLYGVDPRECRIILNSEDERGYNLQKYKHLQPRMDGNYDTYRTR